MTIKQFFEPIYNLKWISFKIYLVWFLIAFSANSSTLFLKWFIENLINKDLQSLFYIIISFFIIYLFTIIYIFSQRKTIVDLEEGIVLNIYKKYLFLFNSLSNQEYEKIWSWRYISVLQSWVKSWENILIWLILSFTITFFIALFSLIQAYLINFNLFLIFLFFIIVFLSTLKFLNKKILQVWILWKEKTIEMDRIVIRTINSKFEIMQTKNISSVISKIESNIIDNKKNWYKYSSYLEGIFTTSSLIILILRTLIYGYFFYLAYNKIYDVSTISMLMLMIWLLDSTLTYFIRGYRTFIDWLKDIKKMKDLFETDNVIKNLSVWKDFVFKKWDIQLENISFKYNENEDYIFNNLNLSIKWGEKIAFVWWTGNGKTTLVKLISWYLNPTTWVVSIDGQNLNDINLESFYENIWYLTQEPLLFDWTIRENLTIWNKLKTEEEIKQSLLNAKCDFVFNFEKSIDTEIWERWIMLSWWQKQRIWLAKIILKNPNIFILDEPTSALDSESEKYISSTLEEITKNKTTIIIAHRLKTIKHCDKIIVLEEGKIKECWNHEDLMKKKGKYFELVSLQSI